MFVLHRQSRGEIDFERLWLGLIALSAVAAFCWLHFGFPTPSCPFRALTGLPCLTCGGTRCVRNLLSGHFATAFEWNPMVFLLTMGVALYALYTAVVVLFRLPRLRFGPFSVREVHVLRVTVALVVASNWIYLIHHFSQLPRDSIRKHGLTASWVAQ